MNIQLYKFGVVGFAVLLIGASEANAQSFTYTDLGTLGGSNSWASAINNAGQIAGGSETGGGISHATLWSGANATDLTPTNLWGSVAAAINSSGQVAGYSTYGTPTSTNGIPGVGVTTQATVWSGQNQTILTATPPPGSDITSYTSGTAVGINDAGQVIGHVSNGATLANVLWTDTSASNLGVLNATGINNAGQVVGQKGIHATLLSGSTTVDLGTLGGLSSVARAINNAGQVVGDARIADDSAVHAALWNGATATDLGTLGGSDSSAFALNNLGQAVGTSGNHAVLFTAGTVIDLNSFLSASDVNAGWVLESASGINDSGWIVGTAFNASTGIEHAFVLTPSVPEPGTYVLTLIGFCGACVVARRHKSI